MNDSGNSTRELKSFEKLLMTLENAVAQARSISSNYREAVGKLAEFSLESDQPVKATEPSPDVPNVTLTGKLGGLIYQLEWINHKNAEIITYFNTLI